MSAIILSNIYNSGSVEQVTTAAGLNAATSFISKANPLDGTPTKKKTELHHALCNMLSSILAPLAECKKGAWPPSGSDHALSLWYDALRRMRAQLTQWMDKQNKHYIVSGHAVCSDSFHFYDLTEHALLMLVTGAASLCWFC